MDNDSGKEERSSEIQQPVMDEKAKKNQQEQAFKPRISASLESLPIPGEQDEASNGTSDNEDSSSSEMFDDDDPLACREKLPSPPAGLIVEDDDDFELSPSNTSSDVEPKRHFGGPENVFQSTVAPDGKPSGVVSNTSLLLKPPTASAKGDVENSSRVHLELPPRRSSRPSIPVKLPGSSPDKPPLPRKRVRAHRPLPTASSRKTLSHRGRPHKKRSLSRDGETSESDELPLISKPDSTFKHVASGVISNADELLNSSTQLAYSWDRLGLGKELGSAALNRYMARLREDEGVGGNPPSLTAQEALQIMSSLRVKTFLPPPGSDLHRIVKKNRFENRSELYGSDDNDGSADGKASNAQPSQLPLPNTAPSAPHGPHIVPPCSVPMKTMSRLYETMCAQDADDGLSNRREAHYLSAEATIEKLRSLENRACALKLQESQILQTGRELGLLDTFHRSMPGYALVQDNDRLALVSAKTRDLVQS